MNTEQVIHNRISLLLGDAIIRKTSLEAECEELRQKVSALEEQIKPVGKGQPKKGA